MKSTVHGVIGQVGVIVQESVEMEHKRELEFATHLMGEEIVMVMITKIKYASVQSALLTVSYHSVNKET